MMKHIANKYPRFKHVYYTRAASADEVHLYRRVPQHFKTTIFACDLVTRRVVVIVDQTWTYFE